MKIGILTVAFPDLILDQIVRWASENGFGMLEVACWPAGQEIDRKYGGVVHIDVESLTPGKISEIKEMLAKNKMEISALSYHPNPLDPDLARRKKIIDHLKKVIVGAQKLGIAVVSTFIGRTYNYQLTGRDWYKDIDYNFEQIMTIWPGLVKFASENNVKIAIENCPMLWPDTWPGGDNLAYSPAIIRRMFKAIPDKNFGINYDPKHLIWLHIDYIRFIYDFAVRIFHIHATDMNIDKDMLYEDGILNAGFSWHKQCLPGLGVIDWKKLTAALYEIKYDYVLSIEHEDKNWEGSTELVKRGFLLAKESLDRTMYKKAHIEKF